MTSSDLLVRVDDQFGHGQLQFRQDVLHEEGLQTAGGHDAHPGGEDEPRRPVRGVPGQQGVGQLVTDGRVDGLQALICGGHGMMLSQAGSPEMGTRIAKLARTRYLLGWGEKHFYGKCNVQLVKIKNLHHSFK